MTWLMDDEIQPGIGMSIAEMTVEPGETSEFHRHGNCSEVIIVKSGSIQQRINDTWVDLKPGEHCLIPASSGHQSRNTGSQTAHLLLVYSEGRRDYEELE